MKKLSNNDHKITNGISVSTKNEKNLQKNRQKQKVTKHKNELRNKFKTYRNKLNVIRTASKTSWNTSIKIKRKLIKYDMGMKEIIDFNKKSNHSISNIYINIK